MWILEMLTGDVWGQFIDISQLENESCSDYYCPNMDFSFFLQTFAETGLKFFIFSNIASILLLLIFWTFKKLNPKILLVSLVLFTTFFVIRFNKVFALGCVCTSLDEAKMWKNIFLIFWLIFGILFNIVLYKKLKPNQQ